MTLIEFVEPLKKRSRKDKILACLYYRNRYEGIAALTVEGIRRALKAARVPSVSKINVADVVAKSGCYVDTTRTEDGKRLWILTESGEQYVRQLIGLPTPEPELEHDAGTILSLVSKIASSQVQDYLREAVKCMQVNALRACVVFLWSGAIRAIQEELLNKHAGALTAALRKHYPKAKAVSRQEHFAYINDKITLLAAEDLGAFDKNERCVLEECLTLRNRCGHPGKYRPGIKRVSSFIEDLVSVVFA
jgi:hypothetical protein